MFIAVLVRRLKQGATFEAFLEAWQAEPEHFGQPVRVTHARRIDEPREILSYAELNVDRATLDEVLVHAANGEAVRHERIASLLESTVVSGIYEIASSHALT